MQFRFATRHLFVLACVTCVGIPQTASAALEVYEGFQYPNGSALDSQNGGTGWNGGWGGGGLGVNIGPGLTFQNLAISGGSATSTAVDPGIVAFFTRPLGASYGADNTDLYISVLLRPDAGFGFYGGINLEGLFIGKSGIVDHYSIEAPTDDISQSAVTAIAGTTVLLVLHAQFLPGNDVFSLYVNPTLGGAAPGGADAVKTNYDMPLASFIYLNNAGAWTTDEIRIGTTFASVTPLAAPEPAAWILFATMLPAIPLRLRRARQKCAHAA